MLDCMSSSVDGADQLVFLNLIHLRSCIPQ